MSYIRFASIGTGTILAVSIYLLPTPPTATAFPPPPPPLPFSEELHIDNVTVSGSVVEVLWRRPAGSLKGTVFLAHGCSHSGTDWFAPSRACAACLGLPEELSVVAQLLAAGYAAAAVSSADRAGGRCWNAAVDGPRVAAALPPVLQRAGLGQAPLLALGASSGGAFVAALPHYMPADRPLRAVAVLIMAVSPSVLTAPLPGGAPYPPLLFAHMPRDKQMADYITQGSASLKAIGFGVKEVQSHPLPVGPRFFSSRIPKVPAALSERAVLLLRGARLLDNSTGALLKDPRGGEWRAALAPLEREFAQLGVERAGFPADASPVAEELNVAWAQHELTVDVVPEAVKFFDEALRGGLAKGGQQRSVEGAGGDGKRAARDEATLSDAD